MADTNHSDPPSSKRRWWIGGGICLAIIGATVLAAWLSLRRDVSPNECLKLEQLKNVSIAHLENGRHKEKRGIGQGELARADAGFAELAEKLPGDPLGPRNLAITRLLELREKLIPAESAVQAAEMMLRVEDQSPTAHLLAGQIALEAGDQARAVAEMARAAELAPNDASIWFAISRLGLESQEEADKKRGYEALGRAFQAEPDNLFLQAAWLTAQARAKDPQLGETLRAFKETLVSHPALVESLRKRGRIADPLAMIEQAQQAIGKNQWGAVGSVLGLANVIRAETWSLNDLRRIDRDPLETIRHNFRVPCDDRSLAAETPPIEVKFNEFPAPLQLPPLLGVADVKLADLDLDGRLDVVALRETAVEIYGRPEGSGDWRPIAASPLPPGYARVLLADLDQDDPDQPGTEAYTRRHAAGKPKAGEANEKPPGEANHAAAPEAGASARPCHRTDLDLVVYGEAGLAIVRNDLNDDDRTRTLNVATPDAFAAMKPVLAALSVDFDHDGDLDLVISSQQGVSLWSNRGDLNFDDVSATSQLPPATLQATSITPVDWDRDVDLDLVLAGPEGEGAGWLDNLRHGEFRWRPFNGEFAALKGAETVAALDADGNGSWALAAAGNAGLNVVHTEPTREGPPRERSAASLTDSPHARVLAWDYDNDGRSDLLSWGETAFDIYRGGGGQFTAAPQLLARAAKPIRGCQSGDIDGDGDLDLAIAEADRIVLYANDGGNKNHWLNLELVAGLVDQQNLHFRVNHYGMGSLVEIRTGPIYQRQIVGPAITHFGLGQRGEPDMVRIVWTNGIPQDVIHPAVDEAICEAQILGGSCPYVYTWTGEKFEFFSDCLWAAPLGLQLADGVLSPSRAWEYLLIPGNRLQARDGRYALQITEELWETLYLDATQLIAVDHPADVAIYSNEKVGPAELAEFKIHTVRQPRRPKAARDQRGRDVLDLIAQRDETYLKAFDRKFGAGYVEPHYLELDLGLKLDQGELERPRALTLFLTGWIFPTSTSMNVGISQNASLEPRRPPSLWVPDANGEWQEVRAYIGFPGGKTKTIAIDLTDAFLTNDYRVRIATNMEIYWDEAFFTLDETPAETKTVPLRLTRADLHYRGFSLRTPDPGYGPEHYDYEQTTTEPKWPAMAGRFTRYGAVEELLTAAEDRMVTLGAGDELTLEFAAPGDEPPPGWTRDYLLYNVGWDKDADLNTVYGQTVEPMPFGAMSEYPYAFDENLPDDAAYQEYLRVYQTRTQDPARFWQRVLRAPQADE